MAVLVEREGLQKPGRQGWVSRKARVCKKKKKIISDGTMRMTVSFCLGCFLVALPHCPPSLRSGQLLQQPMKKWRIHALFFCGILSSSFTDS